jgi:hypothetical protein
MKVKGESKEKEKLPVKKQDVRKTPTLPGSQASKLWLMEAPTACCGKERPGYPRAGRQES